MKQLIFSPQTLGAAIRRHRKAKKLSQKIAGAPLGLEQSTVSSIEKGALGTRLDTLFRMLAALDLEIVLQSKPVAKPLKNNEW